VPIYRFTAVGRDGREVSGEEAAESESALERRLRARRLVLTKARPAKRKRVPQAVVAGLIGQLATLIENGVTIDRALAIAAEDTGDRRISDLAERLRQDIKRGNSLSQALDALGGLDPLLVPLVRAGEASGQLSAILKTLRAHYDRQQRLRSEMIGALAYPVVLVLASLISLIAMGVYVIPTFKDLFAERAGEVPGMTKAVFAFSDLLVGHGAAIAAGLALAGLLTVVAYRTSPGLRYRLHAGVLALPGVGGFFAKLEAGNVMTVLGVLLTNGVSLAPALELARGTARNLALKDGLARALAAVRRGRALAGAVDQVPAWPRLARRLIAVGEESGRLDRTAAQAGESLQEEVQGRLKAAVRLLEPAIILLMGGLVGFIVIAMLLAVYNLTSF
jgi:general secretion pathway protein F